MFLSLFYVELYNAEFAAKSMSAILDFGHVTLSDRFCFITIELSDLEDIENDTNIGFCRFPM